MKISALIALVISIWLVQAGPSVADMPPNSISDSSFQVLSVDRAPDSTSMEGMSAERKALMADYARFNNIWRFVRFGVNIGALALILFTGLASLFRTWTARIRNRFLSLWAFTGLILVTYYILRLPFRIYRGFLVEQDYGFLNQGFGAWIGDSLLGLLLVVIFYIIPVWFLYRLIERVKRWWLVFSVGAVPFIVFAIVLTPIYIDPLFNDYQPITDRNLESEIVELASRVGIEGADIFEVDASRQSSKVNAYVTGLLGSKRIVLYDNLIHNFSRGEIKFVMAHEMGHYVENHIWWGVGVAILFMIFALWLMNRTIHAVIKKLRSRFGFEKLSDYASLPLVLAFASVIMFVFQPITNASSRYMERRSDVYALRHADVPKEVAVSSFEKLSFYNLSDPNPHPLVEFWFYTHPSLAKRIESVRGWGE